MGEEKWTTWKRGFSWGLCAGMLLSSMMALVIAIARATP